MSTPINSRATAKNPFRRVAADFWLRRFFGLADRAPSLLLWIEPLVCRLVFACSKSIRQGTRANARRLLGDSSTPREQNNLARAVLGSFYLFCCDVAECSRATTQQLLSRVEWVGGAGGHETYLRLRQRRQGLIIVTAHMGSFEVAMAALRAQEEHVYVLYRRDAVDHFQRQRTQLRAKLGVHEVAVDDGWTIWITLREALLANQVVVIQGDRVLPGQKGTRVPFLNGELEIPVSPIKLALASGSPILPVFSVRTQSGKIRLFVEEPIEVEPDPATDPNATHPALLRLARVLEKQIVRHPDQWLMLTPAWHQDQKQS